jgi:hypothetical protein
MIGQRIQLRRDTAANWATANPVLLQGEVGLETDTDKFKIGDGTSAWNVLSYYAGDAYTLPVATASTLGGVKQGTGVVITGDGTLNAGMPAPPLMIEGEQGEEGLAIPGIPGIIGPASTIPGPQGVSVLVLDGEDGLDSMIPGAKGESITGATGAAGPQAPIILPFDGEQGEEGMPIPGIPGQQGAIGQQGASGIPVLVLDGEDGQDSMVPGSPGTVINLAAPGTIGNTTPGVMYGLLKEQYITASGSLTALQCSKTIISNYGMTDANLVANLPTAAEGLSFICILPAVRSKYFKFRADTSDVIYLSGTAGSANGYVGVASGYATGSSAQFFTFKNSSGGFSWFCLPIFGTWAAS